MAMERTHTPRWLLWVIFGLAVYGLVTIVEQTPLRSFFHYHPEAIDQTDPV